VSRAEDSDSPSNRPLAPRKAKALWTLHHRKGMTIYDLCAEFKVSPGFVRFKVRSDNGGNSEENIQQYARPRPGSMAAAGKDRSPIPRPQAYQWADRKGFGLKTGGRSKSAQRFNRW